MKLLAIETSTDACSVGLSVDGQDLLDHRVVEQQHGELVLPMIDALMAEAGLVPAQLDGLVFGRGPGSFTGVRIGVAVTQGIALGADVGVVGISTLQSLAQGCSRVFGDTHVAASLDARMDELYLATFAVDESALMQAASAERVLAPAAIPGWLACTEWHWAGSGVDRYAGLMGEQWGVDRARMRCGRWPEARDLLTLGRVEAIAGRLLPPERAAPVYLRDKVAQTTAERAAPG
ncbi:MAG: tRNA (adenosine(37)-N6)-threonylcarbamoyltransferase complex dimerization subunit type 1 TsaB [Granulosicoccus sp.]|nr:tRNA (adenosine(37)-N6)-threonylcarbamoyltransferase complex dimerization subunit type 1 TsaB [Granulosicoccus sp.]